MGFLIALLPQSSSFPVLRRIRIVLILHAIRNLPRRLENESFVLTFILFAHIHIHQGISYSCCNG